MNLEKAVELEAMRKDPPRVEDGREERLSARQVARKVFRISAQAGEPFVDITYSEWARKWLLSDEFVLMEIPLNRVAVVGRPATNGILAAAQGQSPEPIVVDVNKRKIGQTPMGYTPPVIAVDGQTRHQGAVLRGREKIMAWVGVRALKHVRVASAPAIAAKAAAAAAGNGLRSHVVGPTRMDAAMAIHAAMPTRPLPRQDSGDGGPAPTMRSATTPNTIDPDGADYVRNRGAVKRKTEDCEECEGPKTRVTAAGGGGGAGTGGATGGPGGATSGMNPMRKGFSAADDPSDQDQTADPSDRSQIPDPSDRQQSPTDQAPGTGVGPRLRPSKGASNSEMQKKLFGKGKKVDRIFESKKVKAFSMGPVSSALPRSTGGGRSTGGFGGGGPRPMPGGGGGPAQRWNPPGSEGGGGATGGGGASTGGGGSSTGGGRSPSVRPMARQGLLSKAKEGKTVKAVAPPGREAQVKKLKKKFGTTAAYKIAWSQKNEGK